MRTDRAHAKPGAGAGVGAGAGATEVHPDARDDIGGHGPLVCASCGQRITDDDHRIERGGGHEHTFVNPGGFVHHIACFGLATGCSYRGEPETAFSWFPGFSWQIAACGSCHAHLGWLFRSHDDSFHAFIVSALRAGRRA